MYKLLSIANDAKTVKGEKAGWRTGILYLAPYKDNCKKCNVCPFSTLGCRSSCLFTAGRGRFSNVQLARVRKTNYFLLSQEHFYRQLREEIYGLLRACGKKELGCCVRLNGTSDIDWQLSRLPKGPVYYDYTKNFWKVVKNNQKDYYLVYSRTENTKWWQIALLKLLGKNTAVVFDGPLPKYYQGIRVVSGDDNDLRFLDPKGVIVGLKAKGRAKKDTTGFVVRTSKVA